MSSLTEELFILVRPAQGDAKADLLESVLAALQDKAAAFSARAEALTAKRKGSILDFTAEELQAVDGELAVLKIAQEQAAELTGQVRERLAARREADAWAPLIERRAALTGKHTAFAPRFHKFYDAMVKHFCGFAAEYKELEAERARLNSAIRVLAGRYRKPVESLPPEAALLAETPIYSGYMERISLPAAALENKRSRFWTPMAHQGEDMGLKNDDPTNPAVLKKLKDEQAEMEAEHKRRQEALDRRNAGEGGYVSQDIGPRTGRTPDFTEVIAADTARYFDNSTEGDWRDGVCVDPLGGRPNGGQGEHR